jgi:hypothetical protein
LWRRTTVDIGQWGLQRNGVEDDTGIAGGQCCRAERCTREATMDCVAIDEPWVNSNMREKRTKQHHATASCNETVGQVGQGNARSRYAMDEQDPVAVLRAPFVDTQRTIGRDNVPGAGQSIWGVGQAADVSRACSQCSQCSQCSDGTGMLQQQQRTQRGGGDSEQRHGRGRECETRRRGRRGQVHGLVLARPRPSGCRGCRGCNVCGTRRGAWAGRRATAGR